MGATRVSEYIDHPGRRFIGAAAMTVAAAQFGMGGSAEAQTGATKPNLPAIKPGTNTTFAPLKQIDAGLLNVGYAEAGPADGPVVLLLHGWPYDIYSFVDVAPLLASAGYRVIVPYLRGYGSTRFLSSETFRNGQQSVVAVDIVALMDVLKIEKATLGGFDWGARTADIIAALWPERCEGLVSVSGYLIGSQEAGKAPLPPAAELQWWYQYYFATERGRAGYDKYRHDFAKLIWQLASPTWNFNDATFGPEASLNMTIWKSGSPKVRSSPRPPSPSKATPMARPIRNPRLIAANSRVNMSIGSSRAFGAQPASGSPTGLCPSDRRHRRSLIDARLHWHCQVRPV